jgi:hyperosmotically inducible periplasmic protein
VKRAFSSWVTVALFAAGLTIGCGDRADQPNYESRVNDSLRSANIDDVRANWDDDQRLLRLTGEVQAEADRRRAEELAQQVVGTAGRVVNEVEIEGRDTDAIDDRIENQLSRMFEDRTEWDFDGRGVSFDSNAGVVTITGTVESEAVKKQIGTRASQVEGVRDVVNELEVRPRDKR